MNPFYGRYCHYFEHMCTVAITNRINTSDVVRSGLKSYPYLYQWSYKGTGYTTLSHPSVFNEEYLLRLEYSQSQLLKNAEQVVFNPAILYPAQTPGIDAEVQNIVLRRFTEDSSSWEELNASISGFPKDSYGMPYKVPIGMAPIQHLTQFPLFVGTPNNYGNEIWGGIEFDGVVDGVQPNVLYYRSFVDMDTVSGRAFRKADRKQVQYLPCFLASFEPFVNFDVPPIWFIRCSFARNEGPFSAIWCLAKEGVFRPLGLTIAALATVVLCTLFSSSRLFLCTYFSS